MVGGISVLLTTVGDNACSDVVSRIGGFDYVTSIAWLTCNDVVLANSEELCRVNVTTGERVWSYLGPSEVSGLSVDTDAHSVSAAFDGGFVVQFATATGKVISRTRLGAVSGDAQGLRASLSDHGDVVLWEAILGPRGYDNTSQLRIPNLPPGPLRSLAVAGSGETAIMSVGDAVIVWQVKDPNRSCRFDRQGSGGVIASAFDVTGRHVAVGWGDGRVEVIDLTSNSRIFSKDVHEALVMRVALDERASCLASGDFDGNVLVWDLQSGSETVRVRARDNNAVWALAFSPDGTQLAVGTGYGERKFPPESGRLMIVPLTKNPP